MTAIIIIMLAIFVVLAFRYAWEIFAYAGVEHPVRMAAVAVAALLIAAALIGALEKLL